VRLFNLDRVARPLPMPLSNPRTVLRRVTPDHALLCCFLEDEEGMEVVAERACRLFEPRERDASMIRYRSRGGRTVKKI